MNNRIFNEDCMEVFKKIKTESIDCCITDCPYKIIAWWVRIEYQNDECSWILNKRDYSKTDPKWCLWRWKRVVISDWTNCSNKWIKKWDDNTPSAVKEWKMFTHNDIQFNEWLPELYRIMKNWTHTYIMINWRNLANLQLEAEICANTEEEKEKIRRWNRIKKKWFEYQNLLVWNKGNLTPNKYYMQWAEFILMLKKWASRNINNMWSPNIINIPNIIWNKKHPTEKPVELYEYLLKNSTNPNDIIIDPFAWCWPIIECWRNLWLNTIAIEIDKEYFDILKDR